jgi:AcrR family transcriptional regulator
MLYYHFQHKAALYREVLRDVFGAAADAVETVRDRGGDPEQQLRAFIAAVAGSAVTRPHFPSIWLREMAEGGRHLDDPVVAQMRRVMVTLAGILSAGEAAGAFRHVHPLVAQMGIVAPLLFFAASAPVRARLRDHAPFPLAEVTPDVVLEHVQDATLSALRAAPPASHSAHVNPDSRPTRRGRARAIGDVR